MNDIFLSVANKISQQLVENLSKIDKSMRNDKGVLREEFTKAVKAHVEPLLYRLPLYTEGHFNKVHGKSFLEWKEYFSSSSNLEQQVYSNVEDALKRALNSLVEHLTDEYHVRKSTFFFLDALPALVQDFQLVIEIPCPSCGVRAGKVSYHPSDDSCKTYTNSTNEGSRENTDIMTAVEIPCISGKLVLISNLDAIGLPLEVKDMLKTISYKRLLPYLAKFGILVLKKDEVNHFYEIMQKYDPTLTESGVEHAHPDYLFVLDKDIMKNYERLSGKQVNSYISYAVGEGLYKALVEVELPESGIVALLSQPVEIIGGSELKLVRSETGRHYAEVEPNTYVLTTPVALDSPILSVLYYEEILDTYISFLSTKNYESTLVYLADFHDVIKGYWNFKHLFTSRNVDIIFKRKLQSIIASSDQLISEYTKNEMRKFTEVQTRRRRKRGSYQEPFVAHCLFKRK